MYTFKGMLTFASVDVVGIPGVTFSTVARIASDPLFTEAVLSTTDARTLKILLLRAQVGWWPRASGGL
jgi:hypothetical protein